MQVSWTRRNLNNHGPDGSHAKCDKEALLEYNGKVHPGYSMSASELKEQAPTPGNADERAWLR